jgi:guanine deaminase
MATALQLRGDGAFCPTSTPAQLAMAGALCRADAGLYMQTHVAENREVCLGGAAVPPGPQLPGRLRTARPAAPERAVLAHGIWLDAADRARLRDTGAQIAHCPSSNLFLGSGLFDWPGDGSTAATASAWPATWAAAPA